MPRCPPRLFWTLSIAGGTDWSRWLDYRTPSRPTGCTSRPWSVSGGLTVSRGPRSNGLRERRAGHRGDRVGALVVRLAAIVGTDHSHRPPVAVVDPGRGSVEDHFGPGRLHKLGAAFPHHARPELGVLEFLDQRRDVLLVALGQDGVDDGAEQRQVLDPLGGPL